MRENFDSKVVFQLGLNINTLIDFTTNFCLQVLILRMIDEILLQRNFHDNELKTYHLVGHVP